MRTLSLAISGSVLLLDLLTACSRGGGPAAQCDSGKPQQSSWQDPLYPGAQHIHAGSKFQKADAPAFQQTLFATADSAEAVPRYYRETLEKAGWGVEIRGTPAPHSAHFTIANCCAYGWLIVTTTPAPSGITQVTVEHGWGMGCG